MGEKSLNIDLKAINTEKGFFDEFERPTKEQWKESATAALKGIPFDKVMYTDTYEGITIDPIYIADDIEGLPHMKSKPGFQSYVRSTKPEGCLGEPWKICQELRIAEPEDFNNEAKFDIGRGQTGLTFVLDNPSREGQDPVDASANEVGNMGLSLSTLEDMKQVLDGIDLEKIAFICDTGETALPLVSLFTAAVESSGKDIATIQACLGADPIAELAVKGKNRISLKSAYDSMYQVIAWSMESAPKLQSIFIQGSNYHNAGSSSTEEVAFALATASEYLKEMINRGLTVDQVAPRIRFGFSLGSNFFMEIAKLRAARVLWCQIVEAFGGNEDSQKMQIHARTSAFNKTVCDAHVNMLRVTSEGFSGAVGGVDSMHIAPFDELIRVPDRFSRRISRNCQLTLQEESRFTMPIDLSGGSYYVESLTDKFAEKCWGIFQKIEAAGGMVKSLQENTVQGIISETAAKRDKKIQSRQHEILGTNIYANLIEEKIEAPVVNREKLKKERADKVASYKSKNTGNSEANIESVKSSFADSKGKSVDMAIAAMNSGATLAEINTVVSGMGSPSVTVEPLKIFRAAEGFEKLRDRAEEYLTKNGKRLQIFLANMGPIPQHKPRADFAKGFFEVGGFELLNNEGFETSELAAAAALESGAPIVIICSTDPTYPDYVPELTKKLKAANSDITVVVAGRQKPEVEKEFITQGVDEFIHVKANCYELNKSFQDKNMGVE